MTEQRKLVGFNNFVRHNPKSDKFDMRRFHHVEFWCLDATNVSKRFQNAMGMDLVAKSDMSTGNKAYASYVVRSGEILMTFTAPYGTGSDLTGSKQPHPAFSAEQMQRFILNHGVAARAVAIRVDCAKDAYEKCVANGAIGVLPPYDMVDSATGTKTTISEVKMHGALSDVVLRWMSGDFQGAFLPGYADVPVKRSNYFGLDRIDHIVSNVPKLFEVVDYMCNMAGLHEFGEFTADDVGTVDSGLNSMVLANNNEFILMPVNEPTHGTRRRSQIQTYLDQNQGSGIQHIAIKTEDIFSTMREMKRRGECGGFDFMPAPPHEYYQRVPERIGKDVLTAEQIVELEELAVLADKDDQGVLLQIFTQPVFDRTTVFLEIIQRVGCDKDAAGHKVDQAAGCGGFGKGNFSELFKSLENYEKQQEEAVLANK
jgi:4-hydroxyphenylpyruvate dioxygenase